jgi:hypothetical protein
MKIYIEQEKIPVSTETAWTALKSMDKWLHTLSTNKSVEFESNEIFFKQGRQYNVKTNEGITMKSKLAEIDEELLKIKICAHWFLLKSILTCEIKPISDCKCKIIRTQSYPGIIGKIFTSAFNKRESNETSEYLTVWKNYAIYISSTSM